MVVFLCTSKFSVAILCNLAVCFTIFLFKAVRTVFLGKLRDAEYEVLAENSKYAFTETCLALTYFRDELNLKVAALFVALLVAKIFHWLCKERISYMESTQSTPLGKHLRLVVLKLLLLSVDMTFVTIALHSIRTNGPSVWLLFGFEFLCLVINIYSIFARYGLHLVDASTEGGWMNKETYVFYLELIAEVARVFVYLAFFLILFTYYGFPIHILRDLYLSIRLLIQRIQEFCNARNITSRMDTLFPDATEEELADLPICIICREDMTFGQRVKKLHCGHLFHFQCLRTWLERQQSCPTCRTAISVRRGAAPAGNENGVGLGPDNAIIGAEGVNPVQEEPELPRERVVEELPQVAPPFENPAPTANGLRPVHVAAAAADSSAVSHGGLAPVRGGNHEPRLDDGLTPSSSQMFSMPGTLPRIPSIPLHANATMESSENMGFSPSMIPPLSELSIPPPSGMMIPPPPGLIMPPPLGLMMPPSPLGSPLQPFGMPSPEHPAMWPMFTPGGMPSQPISSGLGFDTSARIPGLRRSISSPVGSDRAAQLRSIRSQIEMLEAHLKHISQTKQNDSTPTVALEARGEPIVSKNSKIISTADKEEVEHRNKFGQAPEINLDENARRRVAEEEDQSPQALRRRASAAAALRRISSNSSSQQND
jgi:E3 ubiquitin-protein ligase synoviolin